MSDKLEKLIKKAESLHQQNRLPDVLEVYKIICKIDNKNPNAWMAYGAIAGNVGNIHKAESAFRMACKLLPDFGRQHELLIQSLEVQGKYESALKILRELDVSPAKPPDLTLRIGILYGKIGDFKSSIDWIHQYIDDVNASAHAYHCLATAYDAIGENNKAEQYFISAIESDISNYQLYNNYGAMLHKLGKLDAAINQYEKSIHLNRKYPISHYNIGCAYLLLGRHKEALDSFSTALILKPDYVEAIVGQAKCYHAMCANLYALEIYYKAIGLNNSCHDAYANMGQTQAALGDFDAALESLNKAADLEPDNIETQCAIAQLYEKRGMFTEAIEILQPLLISNPGHKDVVITYSTLCKKLNECEKALVLLEKTVTDDTLPPLIRSTMHYKAGKILDSKKDYSSAIKHFRIANNLQPFEYIKSESDQSLNNILSIFSMDRMYTLPVSEVTSNAPIFIVGMPRSGTTLVEQIIASHPDVYGAGELPYLDPISRRLGSDFLSGKESVTELFGMNQHNLTMLAEQYIQGVMSNVVNESRFTDKMPHNFRLIGLISLLFPNAKIIHCTRNPLDTCLSIYFSNFNALHPYANSLDYLAEYYTGFYQKLMTHWHAVSTTPIYDVSYEALVQDQEGITRRILEICDLNWNDCCLNFYNSGRDVATISYDQVRQPIYRHSISRWRNYKNHIPDLLNHFSEYTKLGDT